jgi:signal transduction histidine kinase
MTTGTREADVRPRRRRSLFFRLLAVMLGTVILTLALLGYFFRSTWNPEARDSTRKNLRQYAELLTRDIGTPPDYRKAERMSDRLKLGIAIRDPEGEWWFSPRVPEPIRERILTREQDASFRHADTVRVHWRKGRMLAVIPQDGYTYAYGSRGRHQFERSVEDWLILFGGIAGLWFLAWLFLRRQLQPVRELARGVRAVQSGNLDARVPEDGSDELAELARSFNEMTRSLRERLRARDQLLLDVSHELRSPLTRMRVALEMTEPGSAVDSLREEVEALGKMVSEVLEGERLQSENGGLKPVHADLNALIREKIARFEETPPGVVLRESPLPPVPFDAERMRLVLRNLVENAIKHGKDSGRPVEVATRREGNFAVIEVRDGGPGVPEEEQRLIFEPFYRTDRSRSGTPGYGLGLPLCKRIVEAHGGTIAFRSAPDEGTVVTVRLPLEVKRGQG